MKMQFLFILASVAAFAPCAAAEETFPIDVNTLNKLTRPGASRIDLGNRITFRVPEKFIYVTEDKMQDFADRMKLALAGDEAAIIMPMDFNLSRVLGLVIIYKIKDDPLDGQKDFNNLNKEALMKWQERFTSDHTLRKAGVGKTWKIGNRTHLSYDADKKILIMGNRMTNESGDETHDIMNYKIFVYGPEKQIVCLETLAPMTEWGKPIERANKLVEEIKFPDVVPESTGNEEMIYYGKLIGGGLFGGVIVIVMAKLLMGGRRPAGASPIRRQGLPR